MIRIRALRRAAALLLSAVALSQLGSCGRDAGTAPAADAARLGRVGMFSVEPVFPRVAGGRSLEDVVQFEKVRIVLRRADGSIALDTTVLFPVGADSVVLAANVPLSPASGNSGENFKLNLDYTNAAGEVVFKGGPVDMTVAPKGSSNQPAPVQIPIKYAGPGATATKVTISPRSLAVVEGEPFSFSAQASDASGAALPNTPILWSTPDPTRLSLPSPGSGAGQARALRGDGRVIAQLLTGQADTVTVAVSLVPRTMTLLSGDGQRGIVGAALAQPVAVKVVASDGVASAGVNVAFAVVTGGGSVASATATTDASGVAQTAWTLGAVIGEQTVSATAAGLAGSPVTFKATARSVAPFKLSFASVPPASNEAGAVLPLVVHALDAQGELAKTFTGAVTLALSSGPAGAPLLGTVNVNAVAGVATFSDVRINRVGTGYSLSATANGLQSASTSAFAVIPGPAQRLEFAAYPTFGAQAGSLEAITVVARDAVGNVATGFAGTVEISLLKSPTGAALGGATKAAAVAGQATFADPTLTIAGEYQLAATSSDLIAAKGPPFPITAGPAYRVMIIAGSGQVGSPGGALAQPITAGLGDRYGNVTISSGVTLAFAASDGGSASPASGSTNSGGQVSASWTLGRSTGTQVLTVSSAGLVSAAATATSTGVASSSASGDIVVIDDVNAFDNSYGFAQSGSAWVYGNAQFIKNLIAFSPTGARAAANKVLLVNDRNNSDYTLTGSNWNRFAALLTSEGLSIMAQTSSHSVFTAVPNDVKLLIIHTPATSFTTAEINGLKAFAAQGGRILMVGENMYYYSYQSNETAFLRAMGSSITVVPACAAPGEIVRSVAHPLTANIPLTGTGGFYQNCASYHTGHGANDTALMYDAGNRVVATVVKVNTTPVTPSAMAAMNAQRAAQEPARAATGTGGAATGRDLTVAPPRVP